ncbi:hypothetical protein OQ252_00535 [Acetobacter farinalis]|uniref:Uncharacterized protein n=1 Tax=Acetobacter farinalis TaxID=1260984 RepID=A0ABT3Q3N8_9PROT|nr:hypothetical protein [Acetobacter farinalis]MCX2559887.1 hypothetical protein [Acetobacter farinalis]
MSHKTDMSSRKQRQDRDLDEALEESFPASDPPSHGGITGDSGSSGKPDQSSGA